MTHFVGTLRDKYGIMDMFVSVDNGPFIKTVTNGFGERWDIEQGNVSPKIWSWQAVVTGLSSGPHKVAFRVVNTLGYGKQIGPVSFTV